MLSFTEFKDKGPTPVAIVVNENKPKLKKTLYMYSDKVADGFNEVKLEGDDKFQKCVDTSQEREVVYVSGMSGSGKSYFCRQYIEKYHKKYPKHNVYVFSSLPSCATLDKLKYLKRIKINEPEFMSRTLTANEFKKSLVLFDDIDVISNKRIKQKVYEIMDSINQIGRHHNVTCLVTSHNACAGKDTRTILNESTSIVLFPKSSGNKTLNYISDCYIGLDKEQTKSLKKVSGRYVCIVRKHPRCMFSERHCETINDS